MIGRSYPERALAAYYRELTRQHRASLPLEALPSRTFAETIAERDYIMGVSWRAPPGGL
jgi:hypothetical protein